MIITSFIIVSFHWTIVGSGRAHNTCLFTHVIICIYWMSAFGYVLVQRLQMYIPRLFINPLLLFCFLSHFSQLTVSSSTPLTQITAALRYPTIRPPLTWRRRRGIDKNTWWGVTSIIEMRNMRVLRVGLAGCCGYTCTCKALP